MQILYAGPGAAPARPVAQGAEVKLDVGTGCTLQGCCTDVAGTAAVITAFMMGPATLAPSELFACWGTTTATATCGLLAGAKPIIQVSVSPVVGSVCAVPVLTAAHR